MSGLSLIVPMAGRGSRFAKQGVRQPKPFVPLNGKPFFWWAVESVRRAVQVKEMIFVILDEHVEDWDLDRCIYRLYPEAQVVAIPEVTAGSAETAAFGVAALRSGRPIIINDCDHAFIAAGLDGAIDRLESQNDATLLTFRSTSPNYSYVELDASGVVTATKEKQVVSDFAIAGCYLFQSPQLFLNQYRQYSDDCPYPELFISGIYNQLLAQHRSVDMLVLERHFAFGTPEEYENVRGPMDQQLSGWR